MAYQAEIDEGDELSRTIVTDDDVNVDQRIPQHDAFFLSLPRYLDSDDVPFSTVEDCHASDYADVFAGLSAFERQLPAECIVGVLMDTRLLPYLYESVFADLNYQRSIAVRLAEEVRTDGLPVETLSLAFFTKGHDVFSITKVREAYRYCPFCEKTTKDYGGKKHLYHSYGTLQRDVWKHPDVQMDADDPLPEHVVERTADMLSSGRYSDLLAISADRFAAYGRAADVEPDLEDAFLDFAPATADEPFEITPGDDELYNGDCIDLLADVPDESVDFLFLDPPYNIGKEYSDHDDDLPLDEYDQWSREWLAECVRVLDEGGVVVALNVPEHIYTQYLYLAQSLDLVNWITWDSMSRPPAGNIMPTNYPILVFSKGDPATVNYEPFDDGDDLQWLLAPEHEFEREFVYPLDDNYCKRQSCIEKRANEGVVARKQLTDLWTDIFRLKHNNKREDHPTMLPPKMMRRLLWLFTDEGDVVLDPFNGVGTTSLSAAQMGRHYTGFELSEKYFEIAHGKHEQLEAGVDPFDKSAKSIAPPKSEDTSYKIPKKDLQMDVKRIADALGHVPTREEVEEHSRYDIDYFDEAFDAWSEATKAAKTTGMSETRDDDQEQQTLYNYTVDQ